MGYVYVYPSGADDFSSIGLVGALCPSRCTHEEQAGGMSVLTLEHPHDEWGKWRALGIDCVLKAPVPVRTTPEIESGQVVTTVEVAIIAATATKAQRTVYSKAKNGKKKKVLKAGTSVIVVSAGETRYKIKSSKTSGWIAKEAVNITISETLGADTDSIESVAPAWEVRDQLFRIYDVERTESKVVCHARHISYDLLGNLTTYKESGAVSAQDALDGILDGCETEHEFAAYTDMADVRTGVDWLNWNPLKALLDPDEGFLKRWGCELVRDDYDLYFLRRAGMDRGARIEYGRNLMSVSHTIDAENVITRILPVGETKKGERLYLPERFIDSPHISEYPVPHVYVLEVSDAKIDDDGVTQAVAFARMREAAQKLLDDGCDLPTISMQVAVAKAPQMASTLDRIYLYDRVRVYHPSIGVNAQSDVVSRTWDVLRERTDAVELGSLRESLASVASWQISSIDGAKIAYGTVSGGALAADVITARHIQANSIYTEALQAGSITAEKVAAGFLYAQELVSQIATIVQANIDRANIGSVEIDYADIVNLKSVFAGIADAQIGNADIDYAQIKTADVRNLITYDAVGEKYYIADLAVSEANIVNLTVGEINLTDSEGNMVRLVLNESTGEITTERVTFDAKKILMAHSITANELNVDEIFANAALIGKITSANIAAGAITVNHLSSDVGAALDISSNAAIRARVTRDELEAAVADATGSRRLELWYTGAGGFLGSEEDESVITAHVYQGEEEITDTLAAALFVWSRDSTQAARAIAAAQEGATEQSIAAAVAQAQADDAQWAQDHAGLTSIQMGASDVMYHSIIACEIAGAQALYAIEIADGALYGAAQTEADGLYIDANGVLRANTYGYALDDYGVLSVETALGDATLRAQLTMTDESASPFRTRTEAQLLVLEDAIESKVTMEQVSDATADIREAVESITPGYIVQTVRQSNEYITDLGAKASASSVTALEQTASSLGARVTSIEDNGVDKVTVSAAMKFDLTGLRITQSGTLNYLLANTSTLGFFNANDRMLAGFNSSGDFVCTALRDPSASTGYYWKLSSSSTTTAPTDTVTNGQYTELGSVPAGSVTEKCYLSLVSQNGGVRGQIGYNHIYHQIENVIATYADDFVIEGRGDAYILLNNQVRMGSDVVPSGTTVRYLGRSDNRWGNVFLNNSPNVSSDVRLKRDIADMDGSLIDHLRPRTFRMKADPQKRRFGFIAQEVQDALHGMGIYDAALVSDENPDSLGMCYEQIIAPLVAKVQEQQRKIDDLEKRFERLEVLLNG